MHKVIVFLVTLFFVVPTLIAAEEPAVRATLLELEKNMIGTQTLQADFVQTKKMKLFQNDLVISGRFYLQKPDKFAWKTESPLQSSIIFDGNNVKEWDQDSNSIRAFDMDKSPVLKAIFGQMKSWFVGEYSRFLEEYHISVENKSPLQLKFSPKSESDASAFFQSIEVTFNEARTHLLSIEIFEKKGDQSHIVFTETTVNLDFDSSTWDVKSNDR